MNANEIVKTLRAIAKRCDGTHSCWYSGALKNAADCIESIQSQLAESQRREKAAVEDLNALRKKSGWKCFACKYDAGYVREICAGCGYNNDNNWRWRGDAEEGDAE